MSVLSQYRFGSLSTSSTLVEERSESARLNPIVTAPQEAEAALFHEISQLCTAISACGMQASLLGPLSDHEAGRQYSVYSQPE